MRHFKIKLHESSCRRAIFYVDSSGLVSFVHPDRYNDILSIFVKI